MNIVNTYALIQKSSLGGFMPLKNISLFKCWKFLFLLNLQGYFPLNKVPQIHPFYPLHTRRFSYKNSKSIIMSNVSKVGLIFWSILDLFDIFQDLKPSKKCPKLNIIVSFLHFTIISSFMFVKKSDKMPQSINEVSHCRF